MSFINLIDNGIIKFDRQLPIYNFFYPFVGKNIENFDIKNILNTQNSKRRALYFHIPFCETICTFCPFTRGKYKDETVVDKYVEALIEEIKMKERMFDTKKIPINAIFFGGGTPSLLSVKNIYDLGKIINDTFDLSKIKEFSFEFELKSITEDKIKALKDIGVTHPRFGLQTFSKEWRNIFNLTSKIDNIGESIDLLRKYFNYVSFDMLYGMSGQDESDIIYDLTKATNLNATNIDIYPIDNVVTQSKLHKILLEKKLRPTSALRKFNMNILIDKFMRSKGFMPHNGHGYYKTKNITDEVVSKEYIFEYHNSVYGYSDYDLLGFGVNAISTFTEYSIINTSNRNIYMNNILNKNIIPYKASKHDRISIESKPIFLRLPYFGEITKSKINFEFVDETTLLKLKSLVNAKLLIETKDKYNITKYGWYWYVNMMYYLMGNSDQEYINLLIASQLNRKDKILTMDEINIYV